MIVYHGTSEKYWQPKSNNGYLFVSENLDHAFYHAFERAKESDSAPVMVLIDTETLNGHFEYLPDNDCHEMDGYVTWRESLNDKGSFILKGDTSTLPSVSSESYINKQGDIVHLLPETATNAKGDLLRWLKCSNGHEASIWDNEFKSQFAKVA